VRYAWIEQHRDDYAVSRLCRLLSVSRTGYLQWRRRPPSVRAQANARLDAQVAAIHAASKRSYGRPRIVRGLRELGLCVGHERVRRSRQRQALQPVYKRPYRVTTDSNHRLPVAPNVLERRFDGWDINRAWVSDITYCSTVEGWLYLAVVMDLASRRIVGWSMSDRLEADLVCQALKAASWRRKPAPGLIMHSDRGSQPRVVATRLRVAELSSSLSASAAEGLPGRVFRASATACRSAGRETLGSVPLGKHCLRSPLLFSLVPRCHRLWGSH